MKFERGRGPKETLGIGIEEKILKYLKAHTYIELRNSTTRNEIFRKIENDMGIHLRNICPPTSDYYMIEVRIEGTDIVIHYEFDVPF